jgi:hypothetical protein
MVPATLVTPWHNQVVPLEPEFVAPQDGHDKQGWLAEHGAGYARLDPIYLGGDLYSHQPICQDVRATGGHSCSSAKASSHPTIEELTVSYPPTRDQSGTNT